MGGRNGRRPASDVPTLLLSALAAVVVPACRGDRAEPAVSYHVSVATGSDANDGSAGSPFKSISKALGVAKSGDTVQVEPGTYGAASGDVFPLQVPGGVALVGDEEHKGAGGTPTAIVGGGVVSRGGNGMGFTSAIDAGQDSTIAGFTITNDYPDGSNGRYAVFAGGDQNSRGGLVRHDHVTIRNNTLTGTLHAAAVAFTGQGADGHVVAENRIVGNVSGYGIRFSAGGYGSKVEDNVITGNLYGVSFESPGGDLGGGIAASGGGNVISCNTANDVFAIVASWNEDRWLDYPPKAIAAANGLWDHVPPVTCYQTCDSACDICLMAPREIAFTTTGARQAPTVCP